MVSKGTSRAARGVLRILTVVIGILVAFALVIGGAVVWSVRRPFPQLRGQARVEILDDEVEVLRDRLGVAHVYARSDRDLYRAQGYVHAQERFWQIDVWRHISAGGTAELFGASQLEADRFLRVLGWRRVASAELGLLSPRVRQMLEDYADGVNAYLRQRPVAALGFEYRVLGLRHPGYEPRPWEPVDTLAFLKLLAWDLRANIESEVERAVLASTLSEEQLADLYPPYPATAPVITEPPALAQAGSQQPPAGSALPAEAHAALSEVGERLAALARFTGPATEGIGSNSWVVDGRHTSTGAPILANDPHLSIQMPSIWYQMALHCSDRSPACSGDVAGFSFAGVPGIIIGHNDRIAWGLTSLPADVMDLYVERINPDNPEQYEVDGQWVDMAVVEETLRVAGGASETIRVRSTHHGPIVSEVYGPLEDVDADAVTAEQAGSGQYAIALRWTALDPDTTIETLPALNQARNWEEFRSVARRFSVPAQNVVYADVDGNIGYQAAGRIPIRGRGDGTMPLPGWDSANDWIGFVPFAELPSTLNPGEGWIVTANNRVAGDRYPHLLTRDWAYGYRASRIEDLLQSRSTVGVEDVQRMQGDAADPSAEWLRPVLQSVRATDARVRMMQELLAAWDGRLDADSAGAAAYSVTWANLLRLAFHDELPGEHRPQGGSRWFEVVRRLLDRPDSDWWDNINTPERENRDTIVIAALRAAADELTERLGDDPQRWTWGALHTATFRNGTLGESGIGLIEDRFNRGPYPVSGGSEVVNATGWNADIGYEVAALPSMRMIVDLGDPDNTRAIHTTGQSGHAYHPHYTSMVERWQDNQQHRMGWSRAAVNATVEHWLALRP